MQGAFIRVGAWVVTAGVGAGLALAGAALTGHLDNSTTIEEITTAEGQNGAAAPASGTDKLTVEQIYRLDSPGVVQIKDASVVGRVSRRGRTLGSGFVIDKAGHIVTSSRVISGSPNLQVSFSGDDLLNAKIVGNDPSTDVAVLQIDAHSRSLSPLPLGDSDQVQVGDPVVAIGNTFDLNRTATVGIVSAVQHGIDAATASPAARAIQTDAAINHGNSGGPLIDTHGQVIGVSAGESSSTAAGGTGVGFAIPIDTVKSVVAQLLQTGKVQHAFLGLDAAPVDGSLARSFSLPSSYGLLVQSVTLRSGAANAGLRAGTTSVVFAGESYLIGGDIIIAANGQPITTEAQLRDVLQSMKPGEHLSLEIWRGARKETVTVKLGEPPG